MSRRQTHEQQTGWRYYGSFVTALCKGPVDVLHAVMMEDQLIFEGPITRDSADAAGMTELETELGTIRFYWGTEDQAVDARVQASASPVSAYRGFCYYVADHILWGDDRANPPHLTFDLERSLDLLPLDEHSSEGDVNPVEALYAFLRDETEGLGFAEDDFDLAGWQEAAERLADEGIWCSVEIDDRHSGRDIIARHLEIIRGRLIDRGGKVGILLDRPEEERLTVGPEDLLEEPHIEPGNMADMASEIYVRFRRRDRRDEEVVEGYVDETAARAIGRPRRREIDMHWVRQTSVARRLVAREGFLATALQREGHVVLRPSIEVEAGDRLVLDYPKMGIEGLRLLAVEVSRMPHALEVEVLEDVAIDPLTLAIPDAPDLTPEEEEFAFEPFVWRMGYMPMRWYRSSRPAGWISACSRPHWKVSSYRHGGEGNVYGKSSVRANYQAHNGSVFPAACELAWMMPAGGWLNLAEDPEQSYWILRLVAIHPADQNELNRLMTNLGDDPPEIFAVGQQYNPAARSMEEGWMQVLDLVPAEYARLVAPGVWDVLAISLREEASMPQMRSATPAAQRVGSGRLLMVGVNDAFWRGYAKVFAPHHTPVGTTRWWGSLWYHVGQAEVSDKITHYIDANDNMQEYGIFGRTPKPAWTPRVDEEPRPAPELPELYDTEAGAEVDGEPADMSQLAQLDEALGNLLDDSDDEEDLFWTGVDEALGKYFETGYYAE